TYAGGEPMFDLFNNEPLHDPFDNPLVHKAGDPILHFEDDPVVHATGKIQRYLGGEPVLDEQGNAVHNADGSALLHVPGQAQIYNGREPVLALVDATGKRVTVGTPYTPATFVTPVVAGTILDLDTLSGFAYDLAAGDQVAVTIFNGSTIFNLKTSEFDVDPTANTITLKPTTAITSAVPVKIT